MNVLEVQEALKDFSQEQLIKEMQMPSGQAPQFLVLSELNRRQRMKQDFEARQAQQQPTVAEKLVAAAGAPQGGIGAMAQAMAPQTDMAMNTGISQMREPMSGEVMAMREGGRLDETVLQRQERMKDIPFPRFRDSQGNLKYTYGDPNNPFLNEEGQKGGSIMAMGAKYLKDQLAGQLGRGGGSTVMAPPAEVSMDEMDIPEGDESTGLRSILGALASGGSERQAESNAMTSEELGEPLRLNVGGTPFVMPTMAELEEMARQQGKTVQQLLAELGQQPLNSVQKRRASRNIPDPAPPPPAGPVDLSGLSPREQVMRRRSERVRAGLNQDQDEAPAPMGANIRRQSRTPMDERPAMSFAEAEEREKQTPIAPRLAAAPDESGTIQDRIMDLLEQRQKSADMDKYLALAQAGFTLMQPTEGGFGEALGKAGVAGIQAYQDASDRYQTGLADVLDTEIALQKAAVAADKTTDNLKAYGDLLAEYQKLQLETGEDYSSQISNLDALIQAQLAGAGAINLGSLSN